MLIIKIIIINIAELNLTNMEFDFLIKGLILGFSVAAPVGPIGILCINRTLKKRFISGFVSGLGAAFADVVYGLIAGLGLTAISSFLIEQKILIQSIGLVFLFYLGIKTLLTKNKNKKELKDQKKGLFKDLASTFLLTISNPATILFFIAVFAGLGISNTEKNYLSSTLLILGVFLGSSVWWLFLNCISYKLRNKLKDNFFKKIDIVSGVIILAFACWLLFDLIKGLI